MELTIGSINARGLGDRSKRREFFNWLRKKQMAMYFIQEAHCTENNMHDWRAKWGYQALFSCCYIKKAGVIILFNNTFTFQISRTYCDPGGRYIICDLITNGKQLTLANIYAPNNDDPTFFTSVFERLADFKCDEVIIGGDYNLVLDVEKDKKGGLAKTHKKSLEVINSFCEDFDLIDVWRIKTLNNDDLHRAKRTPKYNVDLTFLVITFS